MGVYSHIRNSIRLGGHTDVDSGRAAYTQTARAMRSILAAATYGDQAQRFDNAVVCAGASVQLTPAFNHCVLTELLEPATDIASEASRERDTLNGRW